MKYIFGILAAICYALAFFGCVAAKTSIQEIQGGIVSIIGTLFAIAAGIIDSMDTLSSWARNAAAANVLPPQGQRRHCQICGQIVSVNVRKCPHCDADLRRDGLDVQRQEPILPTDGNVPRKPPQ